MTITMLDPYNLNLYNRDTKDLDDAISEIRSCIISINQREVYNPFPTIFEFKCKKHIYILDIDKQTIIEYDPLKIKYKNLSKYYYGLKDLLSKELMQFNYFI